MKIKVIQISSVSPSFFLNVGKGEIKDILKDEWSIQVGKGIKKFFPQTEVECWAIEREYKKEKKEIINGLNCRIFPTSLSLRHGMEISFPMIKAIKEEIKKAEKNNERLILHIHEYHSWQTYLLLFFLKKENFKIVAQHHGGRSPFGNLKKYKRLFLFLPAIILMQFCENLLFKKIDIFYSLSNDEIDYIKNLAEKSKVKFQTMGIDDEYFKQENKIIAREKLGLDKQKKYIIYLGRIKATKGIRELLDAMKEIKENVELLLIGGGPDLNRYKEYKIKNKIYNSIFMGGIYDERKLMYLSAGDCLILPSHTEGAPVVIMEAVARNLPVITTDVGGVRKMIENGREGIIIKAKSKEDIKKAIESIMHWKKKNIKRYAEKYKWKRIIKETFEDYKR